MAKKRYLEESERKLIESVNNAYIPTDWDEFEKRYHEMERYGDGKPRKVDKEKMEYIEDGLVSRGIGGNQLSSLLSTIVEESGGNPFSVDDSRKFRGLIQFSKERYPEKDFSRDKKAGWKKAVDNQLDAIVDHLNEYGGDYGFLDGGKGSGYMTGEEAKDAFWGRDSDIENVTRALTYGFVRPGDRSGTTENRTRVARLINEIIQPPVEAPDILEFDYDGKHYKATKPEEVTPEMRRALMLSKLVGEKNKVELQDPLYTTFDEAYGRAKGKGARVFMWNGKKYSTKEDGGEVKDMEKFGKVLESLYNKDVERVRNGERAQYFGVLNDKPLKNVYPEFDLISKPANMVYKGADMIANPISKVASSGASGFLEKELAGPVYWTKKLGDFMKALYLGATRPIFNSLPESAKPLARQVFKHLYQWRHFTLPDTVRLSRELFGGEDEPESFDAAFKAAREQGLDTFEWNGNEYSTEMKEEGGETNAAEFSLPEVNIYPNNRFGDIARSQGYETAVNWQKVREGVTKGLNDFANDPRTQAVLSILPLPGGIEGVEAASPLIRGAIGKAGNKLRSMVAGMVLKTANPTEKEITDALADRYFRDVFTNRTNRYFTPQEKATVVDVNIDGDKPVLVEKEAELPSFIKDENLVDTTDGVYSYKNPDAKNGIVKNGKNIKVSQVYSSIDGRGDVWLNVDGEEYKIGKMNFEKGDSFLTHVDNNATGRNFPNKAHFDENGIFVPGESKEMNESYIWWERNRPFYNSPSPRMIKVKEDGMDLINARGATGFGSDQSVLSGNVDLKSKDYKILERDPVTGWFDEVKLRREGGEVSYTPSPERIDEILGLILNSGADFVKRLRQSGRATIPDWEVKGNVATHKLGAEMDAEGNWYVFPSVQNLEDGLHDFTDPRYNHEEWEAMDSALKRGDYVKFDNKDDAIWFTQHYKDHDVFPVFPAFEEGGVVDSVKDFLKKAGRVANAIFHPKDAAYAIMRASNGRNTMAAKDVISALINDNGNWQGGVLDSKSSFDYPRMYIYGDADDAEELSEKEKGYGVDYTEYLKSIGRDPSTIKQYRGNFGTDVVLPKSYKTILDDIVNTDKNITIGYSGGSDGDSDNVAHHLGRINKDDSGNYFMAYSDLWDFNPGDYTDMWGEDGTKVLTYLQSWLLDKVGLPFIVRSKRNIKFVPDDDYKNMQQRYFRGEDVENAPYSIITYNALSNISKDGGGGKNASYPSLDEVMKVVNPGMQEGGEVRIVQAQPQPAARDATSVGRPGPADVQPVKPSTAARENPVVPFVASLLPGIGDVIDAHDFIQAAKDRNMVGMALAAAGFIPLVGDAFQEAARFARGRRNSYIRYDAPSRRDDIKESDEELLKKMPDYARPGYPAMEALNVHRRRLSDGAYEQRTGQNGAEAKRELEGFAETFPGIYDRIFDLDYINEDDMEAARRVIEIIDKQPKGSAGTMSDEGVVKRLNDIKQRLVRSSPAFAEGIKGNAGIISLDNWSDFFMDEAYRSGISHELDHAVYLNTPEETIKELSGKVDGWFDSSRIEDKGVRDYISKPMELLARGTQIKDFYGLTDNAEKVTPEMLKFAARHYADNVMDNQMTEFFNGIKDWDKAAEWISKYSTATLPAIAVSKLLQDGKEKDEYPANKRHGGPMSEDGSIGGDYILDDGGRSLYRRSEYIKNRLLSKYNLLPEESDSIISDLIGKSSLDEKFYDPRHKFYGIGQWSGKDLKEFILTYKDGGLVDQIDFLAKKYWDGFGKDGKGDIESGVFDEHSWVVKRIGNEEFYTNSPLLKTLPSMSREDVALSLLPPELWPGILKRKEDVTGKSARRHFIRGGEVSELQDYIYDRLTKEHGIAPIQAIGIVANLTQESALNYDALGDNGRSYGIQQWQGDRRKNLFEFAKKRGRDKPALDDQVDFLVEEYKGNGFLFPTRGENMYKTGKTDKDMFDYFQYSKLDFDNAANIYDSTRAWAQGFGRGNKNFLNMDRRFHIAKTLSSRYNIDAGGQSFYTDMGYKDEWGSPIPEVAVSAEKKVAQDDWMEKYGNKMLASILAGDGEGGDTHVTNNYYVNEEGLSEDEKRNAAEVRELQQKQQAQELLASIIDGIKLDIKGVTEVRKQ